MIPGDTTPEGWAAREALAKRAGYTIITFRGFYGVNSIDWRDARGPVFNLDTLFEVDQKLEELEKIPYVNDQK